MTKRRILAYLAWALIAFSLVIGIRLLQPSPATAQGNSSLLVSAATSLKEALEETKQAYQRVKPTVTVRYNLGASGALQQQIENGAPTDIFISAAAKQMDALQQKNLLLPNTRRNLLTNSLVLIVPSNSTAGITSFGNLTGANVKRIAVGEPRSVPAGQYTEQVFQKLGILQQLKPKFVYGNNVRNILAAVESGNADAGVVYATDARTSNRVKVVATAPQNLHSPIVYPVAVLKSSKNATAARDYLQFLTSNTARSIFQKYGFGIAR